MFNQSLFSKYVILAIFVIFLQFFSGCQSSAGTGQVIEDANISKSGASAKGGEPIAGNEQLTSMSDAGQLIDFSLTDQNGKNVNLASLKGEVWVADFFFTSCQGACPIMTAQMAKLEKNLGASGLHLLSISVDPAVDTTEKLADYAKKLNAKENWYFVTGEKSKIIELSVKGFRLSADEDPTSHSQRLVLIDRNSHIRGYYHVDRENEMKLLEENAKKLLNRTKESN